MITFTLSAAALSPNQFCDAFRDQVEELKIEDKDKIIDILKSAPAALEADDIEDFCSLAQYYASKTPQSFRRVSSHIS